MVLLFVGLVLSMMLAALNQTVLSTALPTIVGELNGAEHMVWIITGFIMVSTITMPIYGKLGDLFGRKNLLIVAISLFMAGSVLGGLAPDMGWLIAARAIQGLGGGGLIILSQAIIADVVPARDRGKYLGIIGGVFAVASVIGPLLGGWFTEGPGWRWVFWINLPLGALAILSAAMFMHLPKRPASHPRIDVPGMLLISGATTGLVLVTSWGGTAYAWGSAVIVGLVAGTIVTAVLFVLVERKAVEPIIPLTVFRDRNFNLTTVAGLMVAVPMFGLLSYMPTYFQMATGVNATVAGLLMLPMMVFLLITSIGSGSLVSRYGHYKLYPVAGSLILAAGLLLLSGTTVATPIWTVCAALAVTGAGLGLIIQILVIIVQNSFPQRMVGTATAANNYFRQIGATLGTAVIGTLFSTRLTHLISERVPGTINADGAGGADSLTPELVHALPAAVRVPIVESYNDAMMPLFLFIVPLAVLAAVLMAFIQAKPLATTIEQDLPPEQLPRAARSRSGLIEPSRG